MKYKIRIKFLKDKVEYDMSRHFNQPPLQWNLGTSNRTTCKLTSWPSTATSKNLPWKEASKYMKQHTYKSFHCNNFVIEKLGNNLNIYPEKTGRINHATWLLGNNYKLF